MYKKNSVHAQGENKHSSGSLKPLIIYYIFVIFYFIQTIVRIGIGFRFYPANGLAYTVINTGVALLGLYGYIINKNEKWIHKISVWILPLTMVGLVSDFHSYPMLIPAFYIAITCRCSRIIKWLMNFICAIPFLFVISIGLISPLGFLMAMGAEHSFSEIYSADKKYVAVIDVTNFGATGGSLSVCAGRYLDLGVLGKYLPDKTLFYGSWGDGADVKFAENDNKVFINGKLYRIQ